MQSQGRFRRPCFFPRFFVSLGAGAAGGCQGSAAWGGASNLPGVFSGVCIFLSRY